MSKNVMVDLETLGLASDSVIVSIGAVAFTETGITAEAYWPLQLDAQPGRHVELGTVKWWMQQSNEARKVFSDPKFFFLRDALRDLGNIFDGETRIWSNGANFDEPMLKHAYSQIHLNTPWNYKNVRCYRTIRAQHNDVQLEITGVAHNALDDARYQAQVLLKIMKEKGIDFQ